MLTVLALCVGASLGAISRWQLGLWLSPVQATLPWGTLAANWLGAYAIGVAVVFFQSQAQIDPAWRLAIITGFLGALTTFSTFSLEVVTLLQQGRWALAAGSASLHLFGSLLLTWAGLRSATLWWIER
jgi:CrcB protein